MNNPAPESCWDRSKRLESAFPAWCQKVASALSGSVDARRVGEHFNHWQIVTLPDGLTFCLHLAGYESRVSVSGDWPKDDNNQTVTPRDALRYDTEAASIHVGAERDPAAVAKDITRRFISVYRDQYAACLKRVAERNDYKRQIADNAERIAAVLGVSIDKNNSRTESGEVRLYPHRDGLYQVCVSSEVRFELRLPVEKAEQVLRLLNQKEDEHE